MKYLISLLLLFSNLSYASQTEINCLAAAIFFEARGEIRKGQEAVAQVIMNRARARSYPPSVCKVVKQPFQFSWYNPENRTEHTINVLKGRLSGLNAQDRVAYQEVKQIALRTYTGLIEPNPNLVYSLYFVHKDVTSKQQPWLKNLRLKAKIGSHRFY
jgi:spore germination cell wall hydrolase CwlJ-like protein